MCHSRVGLFLPFCPAVFARLFFRQFINLKFSLGDKAITRSSKLSTRRLVCRAINWYRNCSRHFVVVTLPMSQAWSQVMGIFNRYD